MNVFIIPSWYPSESNPLNGIQIKEQTLLMARHYPDITFGISRWGQNDEDYLLHSRQPLRSLRKLTRSNLTFDQQLSTNVWEFFSPAYSWHSHLKRGNINKKIEANLNNLKNFERTSGKPNIIHAHVSYPAGYIAHEISHRTGIPYVITERMGPFPQKYHLTRNKSLKPEIARAMTNCNVLVSVSSHLKKDIENKGIDRPINVIPNFTDRHLFKPIAVKREHPFTFVTACGMLDTKGVPELLEAINLVLQKNRSMHFLFIGDGPQLIAFKKKATELNIDNSITWAGYQTREKMHTFFSAADAHILCSHYESFGVVYIEAMAMGLPNIAAAIGGPLDIIDDETGILVKEVKPELIAEKILWMVENHQQFDAKTIRKSFEERFSVEAVAPKIRALYESLL